MSAIPYRDVLGDRDPVAVIAEMPQQVAAVYAGLTDEDIEARPAPGKWNLREVLCHLADCEIVWGWRLRIALEKERAEIQPFEQDPWAKMYGQYSLAEAQATFFAMRAWNITFINGLSEADKRKPTYHPERGEETLWTLVEIMAGHDIHHLATFEKQQSKRPR